MADPKDLDETRRLLYMTLAAPHTKRYNLAGTLTNALIHHSSIDAEPSVLLLKVIGAVDGEGSTDWIWDQINRITAELDVMQP